MAACLCATDLEISTDYLSNFPPDSEVVTNFGRIKNEFAGAVPLQVIVSSELDGAFNDPVHLASLKSLEQWLEAQPEIGKATTLVDFVELLHRSFEPQQAQHTSLSATRGEVEDLFFLTGGNELERFVDRRKSTTIMHLQTSAISTRELVALVERIEQRLDNSPLYFHAEVTGSSALLSRTLDDIVRGQITSLFGALAVIYSLLLVLFGSASVAALALLPNMLPIVCFFGLLGATGITLNLSTSLVAAVVLGIAVDDTMHFLSRFNTEARRVANEAEGLGKALASVIRPVTYTTAALCCGFFTLTFGELRSQVEFGMLAALTLLIAWVIDLTFTPALAGRLRFVTLWEALSVDLGKAPNETIPFFAGLSNRQARVAALLGSIETFKRGDPILTLGEEGGDIHVVIDGEAVAYLSRDDHEEILRPLKRGDLIGEVTLFRGGLRTANVRATSDMRLLYLDNQCLARIQQRYPKIGAQLYRNLGLILADRLADVTERL
ncbi:MAG: MMPL family transporter [Pseudomonadota bacterium]